MWDLIIVSCTGQSGIAAVAAGSDRDGKVNVFIVESDRLGLSVAGLTLYFRIYQASASSNTNTLQQRIRTLTAERDR